MFLCRKVIVFILLLFLFSACNKSPNSNKIINKKNTKYDELHKEDSYKELLSQMKALDYRKATKTIKSLIIKHPKNPELYYLLAIITKNSNPDPLKAIKLLEVALKLDNEYGKAWKLLGDLYYIRGNLENTLKAWEMAIETIQKNATLYYRLANIYYGQKDYKIAIKYFEKSLKVDNKLEWSYYYLGEIYFKYLRNPKKGIEYLKKGLKILPESKSLNQKLAIFYYDTQKYQEAIKWNKEVLKIVKYDNFAIENISDAYMQLKNYDKAIEWLDKVLKEQPKSVYYIKKMAEIYLIKKDFNKSIELFEFAYNLKNDSDLKSKIAKLYQVTGKETKYKEIMNELKSSGNPSDARAFEYLSMENSNNKKTDTKKTDTKKINLKKEIDTKKNK